MLKLVALALATGCATWDPPEADATDLHERAFEIRRAADVADVVACFDTCVDRLAVLDARKPSRMAERTKVGFAAVRDRCETLYDWLSAEDQAEARDRAGWKKEACIGPDPFDPEDFCLTFAGAYADEAILCGDDPACAGDAGVGVCKGFVYDEAETWFWDWEGECHFEGAAPKEKFPSGDPQPIGTCPVYHPLYASFECGIRSMWFHLDERCATAKCDPDAEGFCFDLAGFGHGLQVRYADLDRPFGTDACGSPHLECVPTDRPVQP